MAQGADSKILVIEDDPSIRKALEDLLSTDYDVHTAVSGEAAVRELEGGLRPRAIILDLRLPGLSGEDLLIRKRTAPWRSVPVIAITAMSNWQQRYPAVAAEAEHVLMKPFEMERLFALLESLIRLSA